jgi:hypothetical protein
VITVPYTVGVIIVVLAALIWIFEQVGKARARQKRRLAKSRLAADLRQPKPAETLPYGFSPTDEDGNKQP